MWFTPKGVGSKDFRYINQAEIMTAEGRSIVVTKGSLVVLKPEEGPKEGESERDSDDRHFAEEEYRKLLRELGSGPYSISRIGRWPCGKVIFHLTTEQGESNGKDAKDFLAASVEEVLATIDFEKSDGPGPEGPTELQEDFDSGGVIEPGDVPRFGHSPK